MIWFLEAIEPWEPWYDKTFSFVVSAKNEVIARVIASDNHGDEGKHVWLDPQKTRCRILTGNEPKGLICRNHLGA
jgi:hypothetical protein